VLRLALPIVLSNATVPLLGAVDTGVVGQMGEAAPIGAVGLGAVILTTLYGILGFLRMGTTGLAAQARGAGDDAEAAAVVLRALLLGAVAGVALILAQGLLVRAAFALAPASAEVEAYARAYLAIRIWGAPAAIMLHAVTGWLIAAERTRGVLALQLWMNGLNALLDLWFVLGLGWGVGGVAAATLIAEGSGLALGLWLCRDRLAAGLRAGRARVLAAAPLRRMLAVNRDIMLRSLLLQAAFAGFLFLASGMGDVTLAANKILLQFLEVTAFALDGFAFAAEALVGGAVGAAARAEVRRAALMAAFWGAVGAVLLALGFAVAGGAVIDLMSTSAEVRAEARAHLPWLVMGPLIGVASWTFDGIFTGATWTREMRNAMLVSVAVYAGALSLLVPAFGNHGLWAALMVLNGARAATMAALYPRLERRVGEG
jgi:MATE family multidrug resistance protein